MKKISCKLFLIFFILLMSIWGISILKCEILTYHFGKQFEGVYQENTMIGEIEYLKVLNYSNDFARVYFVSKNRTCGNVLTFSKQGDGWMYDGWEKTVWSKQGSADGFIWPYIR